MKHIKLFEEFKVKKTSRIKKHIDIGKPGTKSVTRSIGYKNDKDILEDIMETLVKRFKLDVNKVKYLDSGMFGMAFIVGGDKIIKLTSSSDEALNVKKLIGKNIPHVVNYYDIVYIKKYGIYAILMDRAKNLSEIERDVVDYVSDGYGIPGIKHLFKRFEERTGSCAVSKSIIKKIYDDCVEMKKSLKKSKVSIQDLHAGNVGYLNDKMVHFDIMGHDNNTDNNKISKLKIK